MTDTGIEGRERAEQLARSDWGLAAALAVVSGLLFALTFQTRTCADGHGLVTLHVLQGKERYQHALYLPLCDLVQGALGLRDPFLVLHLISIAGGGLGLGAGYLVLRLCGAARSGALVAIGLAAFSPALWFFATTVHTQPLLFGAVACLALFTLLAPWQRPGLALALVAALFPLLFLAHESSFTLGPGWVLLVQFARARRGSRFSWPGLLLGVGPLLLAALGLGLLVSMWMRFGSLAPIWDEFQKQLQVQSSRDSDLLRTPPVWRDEWLLPQGLLVPLAAAGFARLPRANGLALAVAFLVGVPTLFFLWWGVFEHGGYFLGSQLFLLVPVAFLFARRGRAWVALALALLAGQALLARHRIDAYDTGWDPAERNAQVRAAIGESGLLLTTAGLAPDVRCWLPGVEERSLTSFVRNACKQERRMVPPERILAQLKPRLDTLLERSPRVCVELGYPAVTIEDAVVTVALVPHLRVLEAYLRERYEVRDLPHPWWPMMVLVKRR